MKHSLKCGSSSKPVCAAAVCLFQLLLGRRVTELKCLWMKYFEHFYQEAWALTDTDFCNLLVYNQKYLTQTLICVKVGCE